MTLRLKCVALLSFGIIAAILIGTFFTKYYHFVRPSRHGSEVECCPDANLILKTDRILYEDNYAYNCSDGAKMKFDCDMYEVIVSSFQNISHYDDEYHDDYYDMMATGFTIKEDGGLRMHYTEYEDDFKRGDYCIANSITDNNRDVALVCLESQDYLFSIQSDIVIGILRCISVVFLVAVVFIYVSIRDLRGTQDVLMITYCACYAVMLMVLAFSKLTSRFSTKNHDTVIISFLILIFTHILYYCSFTAMSFNLWKQIVLTKWKINERTWLGILIFAMWGLPLAITLHYWLFESKLHEHYLLTEYVQMLWNRQYYETKLAVILNFIVVNWIGVVINFYTTSLSETKTKYIKNYYAIHMGLFVIFTITWFNLYHPWEYKPHSHFMPLSNTLHITWEQMILSYFNAISGIVVFMFLVVIRKGIFESLAEKRCLRFCTRCAIKDDGDDEDTNSLTEMENY